MRALVFVLAAFSVTACARFGYDQLGYEPTGGGPIGDSTLPPFPVSGDAALQIDSSVVVGDPDAGSASDAGAPGSDTAVPGSDVAPTGGILTVVPRPMTPGTNVQLTTLGSIDWGHWGVNGTTDFNRKLGGSVLVTPSSIGGNPFQTYGDSLVTYTWTDGTPTAAGTNETDGVWVPGVGNGFQLSLPADSTLRSITIYIGVWRGKANLRVSLSDNSAAAFVDSSTDAHGMGSTDMSYGITYRAASTAQTLSIEWTLLAAAGGVGMSNVTWQAATIP